MPRLGRSRPASAYTRFYGPRAGVAHTATASLTVTPQFTATTLHARFRTASLTVTPRFSASASKPGGPAVIFSIEDASGSQSHLSLQYRTVPVTARKAGAAYNPTGDAVAFAFMPQATQVPQSSDWVAGSWDTVTGDILFPYLAKCLVGPGGTISLGIGTYVMYLKISDNPQVPVLIAGYLEIT